VARRFTLDKRYGVQLEVTPAPVYDSDLGAFASPSASSDARAAANSGINLSTIVTKSSASA